MTQATNSHPDFLRRFVPIIYSFDIIERSQRVRVQSNDLELALITRRFCVQKLNEIHPAVLVWKLIRDAKAPVGLQGILLVTDGPLRTIYLGRGTVLSYDRERSEILGFVDVDVTAEKIIRSLVPILIGMNHNRDRPTGFYKQVTNNTLHDDNKDATFHYVEDVYRDGEAGNRRYQIPNLREGNS
jgi:hypothetical protein